LQHALSANPGRRVGGRSTAQWDPALGCGGEGGWSRDATEEVGSGTVSARGPPRVRGEDGGMVGRGHREGKECGIREFFIKK